jgi:hypothetical protein
MAKTCHKSALVGWSIWIDPANNGVIHTFNN